MRLYVERIGYHTSTRVRGEDGRVLETTGLGMEELVSLWKWYYHIAPWEQIVLLFTACDFVTLEQRTLASSKSVKELFESMGIECRKLEVGDA